LLFGLKSNSSYWDLVNNFFVLSSSDFVIRQKKVVHHKNCHP
jgi:hypothetical protein